MYSPSVSKLTAATSGLPVLDAVPIRPRGWDFRYVNSSFVNNISTILEIKVSAGIRLSHRNTVLKKMGNFEFALSIELQTY